MSLHTLAIRVKPIIPPKWFRLARGVLTALLTPIWWSRRTGHWRSALRSRPLDAEGNPTIWYTYPAVEFLSTIVFSDRRVLEIGAGYSSICWAHRSRSVTALESDPKWYESLLPQLPTNATLHLVDEKICEDSIRTCESNSPYDVVIIDGLDRLGFALNCQDWLTQDGVVIVDNADGYWGNDDLSHPIVEHLQSLGFQRVDFYGYCADGSKPGCTSIFFRDGSFLFRNLQAPLLPPDDTSNFNRRKK